MSLENREGTLDKPFIFPASGNTPLQVTKWTGSRIGMSVIITTVRILIPAGATVIEIASTENCYIAFGDVTVDATSTIGAVRRLFMAGVQVAPVPLDSAGVPHTYLAAIRLASDGVLQVERVN